MSTTERQNSQVLAALEAAPLDRIRLMKTLFLVWHRNGRPVHWPFTFTPYLYGPCSFEVYSTLDELKAHSLVVQPSLPIPNWAPYHLTAEGRKVARKSAANLDSEIARQIVETARWAHEQGFRSLLKSVYGEAPDFAVRSVAR